MSWWSDLINALNPCVHQWQVVETLKDDPENPRKVNIVRECTICGTLDQQSFTAPDTPPDQCPPHKWETTHTVTLYKSDEMKKPVDQRLTSGMKYHQTCKKCGELRAIQV